MTTARYLRLLVLLFMFLIGDVGFSSTLSPNHQENFSSARENMKSDRGPPVSPLVLALPTGVLFAPVAFLYGPHRARAFPPLETVLMNAATGVTTASLNGSSAGSNASARARIACANISSLRCYLPNTAMLEPIPVALQRAGGGPDTGGPTAVASGSCSMFGNRESFVSSPTSAGNHRSHLARLLAGAAAVVVDPAGGMVRSPQGDQPFTDNNISKGTVSERWWPVLNLSAHATLPPPAVTRDGTLIPPLPGTTATPTDAKITFSHAPDTVLCLLEAFAQAAADGNQSDAAADFPVTILGHTAIGEEEGPSVAAVVTVARLTGLLLVYGVINQSNGTAWQHTNGASNTGVPLCDEMALQNSSSSSSSSNSSTNGNTSHTYAINTTTTVLFTPANVQGPSLQQGNSRAFVPLTACTQSADNNYLVQSAALVIGYDHLSDLSSDRGGGAGGMPSSDPFLTPPDPKIILPSRAYIESGIPLGTPLGRGPWDNDTWSSLIAERPAPHQHTPCGERTCGYEQPTTGYAALTAAPLMTTDISLCIADYVVLSVGGGPMGLEKDAYSLFPSDAIVAALHACLFVMPTDDSDSVNVLAVTTVLSHETLVTLAPYSQYLTPFAQDSLTSLLVLRIGRCDGSTQAIFPPVCPWTFTAADLAPPPKNTWMVSERGSGAGETTKTITWWYRNNINDNDPDPNDGGRYADAHASYLGVLPPSPQCTPLATFLASFGATRGIAATFAVPSPTSCQSVVAPPTPRDLYGLFTTSLRYNFLQAATRPATSPDLLAMPMWQANALLAPCADFAIPQSGSSLMRGGQVGPGGEEDDFDPPISGAIWSNTSSAQQRPLTNAEALCAFGQFATASPSMASLAVQWSCGLDNSDGQVGLSSSPTVFMSSCDSGEQSSPPLPWERRWAAFVQNNPSLGRYVADPYCTNVSSMPGPSSPSQCNHSRLLIPPYFAENNGGLPLIAVNALLRSTPSGRTIGTASDLASLVYFRCSVCQTIGLEPGMAPLPYALVVASALKDALVIAVGVWILSLPKPRRAFASFVANISTVLIPLRDPALTAAVRVSVQRALSPISITPNRLVSNLDAFLTWGALQGEMPLSFRGEGFMDTPPTDKDEYSCSSKQAQSRERLTAEDAIPSAEMDGDLDSFSRANRGDDVRDDTAPTSRTADVEAAAFAVYCLLYLMRGGQRCFLLNLKQPTTNAVRVGDAITMESESDSDMSLHDEAIALLTSTKQGCHFRSSSREGCHRATDSVEAMAAEASAISEAAKLSTATSNAEISAKVNQLRICFAVCVAESLRTEAESGQVRFQRTPTLSATDTSVKMRGSVDPAGDGRNYGGTATVMTPSDKEPSPAHLLASGNHGSNRRRRDESLIGLQQATLGLWTSLEARRAMHPAVFAKEMIDRRITPPAWLLVLHVVYVVLLFLSHSISVWTVNHTNAGLLGTPWARYQSFYFRFVNATTVVGLLVDALLRVWYSPPLPPSIHRPLSPAVMDALLEQVKNAVLRQQQQQHHAQQRQRRHAQNEEVSPEDLCAQDISCDFQEPCDSREHPWSAPVDSGSTLFDVQSSRSVNRHTRKQVILEVFLAEIGRKRTPRKLLLASARDPFVLFAVLLPLPVLLTHALPGIILYAWVVIPLIVVVAVLAILPGRLLFEKPLRNRIQKKEDASAAPQDQNTRTRCSSRQGVRATYAVSVSLSATEADHCDPLPADPSQRCNTKPAGDDETGNNGDRKAIMMSTPLLSGTHQEKEQLAREPTAISRDDRKDRNSGRSIRGGPLRIIVARLLVRVGLTIACTILIQSTVNWMVLAYSGGGQSRASIPQLWQPVPLNTIPPFGPIVNSVPNTFLFLSRFPALPPPNPADPTDAARLANIERLQDGLYVGYVDVLRLEYESRTFTCAYEQLRASFSSAMRVLSFLF